MTRGGPGRREVARNRCRPLLFNFGGAGAKRCRAPGSIASCAGDGRWISFSSSDRITKRLSGSLSGSPRLPGERSHVEPLKEPLSLLVILSDELKEIHRPSP